MLPPELIQLAATFGTPAALLMWMWQQSRRVREEPAAENVVEKIDEMRELLHSLDNRMTRVETILQERPGAKPPTRRS